MNPDTNKQPLWRRYARFFGADPAADAREELAFHLESKTEELIAQGWSAEAARKEARRQFGELRAIERIGAAMGEKMERKRRLRDYAADLAYDIRYTLRTLRRDAGFTAVAIAILALAIGANIAVFSVVNTLLLRSLPFPNAQQLVWIAPPPAKCGLSCATYSADAYDEFRAGSRSYQDVTGYEAFSGQNNLHLQPAHGDPIPVSGIDVITNFFQVLGVKPQMGHLFTQSDVRSSHPGAPSAVLLSNAWWKHQFDADPNIVGKAIDLNGTQATIIGVLPASFDFGAVFSPGSRIDAFTPLNLDDERDWGNIVTFIGRLKPGVTVAQAKAEAAIIAPKLYWNVKQPQTVGYYKAVPVPLKQYVSGRLRRSLFVLWSAVGMILLIACVNLSNLLLARASARGKEWAMRGALGASRARIIRQLLTESLILSAVGAIFGLILAAALLFWLSHQGSVALPLLSDLRIDTAALGWTLLITVTAALFFGVVPGMRMARINLQEALKDSGSGSGQSRKHERVRSILVVTEVALACMLLVGAGLLLRSFLKVVDLDLGFQPSRAAAVTVDYDDHVPGDQARAYVLRAEKRSVIFQQILSRIMAIPGIQAAGTSDYLPLGRNRAWGLPIPQGRNPNDFKGVTGPLVYVVSPGYIRAMGMRLRGRDFTWDDGPNSPGVVLISASMAHFLWPNEDAVGKILVGNGASSTIRVIGVVDDVRATSVEGATGWQIYYPITQTAPNGARLVIRTTLPPAIMAASVLHVLRELNPKQTAAEFLPIQTLVDHANSPRRFFMLLVVAFATLGLLLAALGIYGVISYAVTRQTQEIGVRMALGASAGRVQRQVLVNTLRLALAGVVLGTAASLIASQLIAAMLFEVSPWDAGTFAATAAILVAIAVVAGYLPARRASRIDPMVALRSN